MDRCDFSSIMTILRSYIRENNQLNQSEFLYEVFDDFLSSPEGADFSFDNGLVCRWMSGQAKVSPKLINYYSAKSSQMKLSDTLEQMILPMMFDPNKTLSDVYLLFIQDPSISDKKKEQLSSLFLSTDTQTLFLSQIICFGMERTFVKRDTNLKYFFMAYRALEKVNWLKHMPENIKNTIPTSFILNTLEICISLLRRWTLQMICPVSAKKSVFRITTATFAP